MSEGSAIDQETPFRRLALIGIGLIGSSVARAARQAGVVEHIAAYSRTEKTRAECSDLGLADSVHADPADAVRGADLVILCVHLGAYPAMIEAIAPVLEPAAILSDVGSVKRCVFRDLEPSVPAGVHLIPAHPIAGTEKSGPTAGFAELFENRWTVLTPPEDADQAAVARLSWFWRQLGSDIEIMDAEHHDLVMAVTSHLPHMIAYNIVGTADDLEAVTKSEVIKFSAGGFRDFTRIAASPPEFWRDVFLNNREAMIEVLGRFTEDLIALQRAVRWGDGELLLEQFTNARGIRQRIIDAGQETDITDFGRHPEIEE